MVKRSDLIPNIGSKETQGIKIASWEPVGPPGHAIQVAWKAAAGATGAEVTQAEVLIDARETEQDLGDLPVQMGGSNLYAEVSVPVGKRIIALNLQSLKDQANALLLSQSDLSGKGLRLVVTAASPGSGFGPPLYAVPPSPGRGMLPAALTGASFSAGTLRFDQPLDAAKIRLALVSKDFPEDFAPQALSVGKVSGVAAITPIDLTLSDPAGSAIWSFPGEMPAGIPTASADLKLALETAIENALGSGTPLDFTFKLQAAAEANARVQFKGTAGFLLREFPGILKSTLQGDPQAVPLDGAAPPAEAPSAAVADMTVRYQGIRILDTVSDPLPGKGSPVSGIVVSAQAVLRSFPAQAFGSLPVAWIGLVGRAPEDTELVVQPVDLSSGAPGSPFGSAGVIKLEAQPDINIQWVQLPDFSPPGGPLGLAVHTNKGRFFWACDRQPLVRVAVFDPDPGGRWLRLAGSNVLQVDQVEIHQPGFSLPAAAFRSSVPEWESDLFLKVDLSDLVLRYRRTS